MLTLHARKRIKSRVGIKNPKDMEQFVFNAWMFGRKIDDKERKVILVEYENWKLLFGRNNKRLITIYERNLENDKQ